MMDQLDQLAHAIMETHQLAGALVVLTVINLAVSIVTLVLVWLRGRRIRFGVEEYDEEDFEPEEQA